MLDSRYLELCPVDLPYRGRQKYMHTFDLAKPVMAVGFEDYLEPVKRLCHAAMAFVGVAHMTVDERIVDAGKSQRRPGPHVDGCFMPMAGKWGHDGPGPTWLHYCNNTGTEIGRMPVIVAANVVGCRCYPGVFDGAPREDGDLGHLKLPKGENLRSNVGYLLSADCVHESLPMLETIERTFLRIALPVNLGGKNGSKTS